MSNVTTFLAPPQEELNGTTIQDSLTVSETNDFWHTRKKHEAKTPTRTIRKLEGYLERIEGNEAIVCFLPDDIEMAVPARPLCENGIVRSGQPFEYTEFESRRDGFIVQSYSYIPLCEADDFARIPLDLPPETKMRLNALLKK